MDIKELNHELGNADLFLIDHLLKGRFNKDMRILDAGCGEGRNMTYFLRNGYNISGLDKNADAIRMAKIIARSLNKEYDTENIKPFAIENNTFPDNYFDAILCINVLHFSEDESSFFDILNQMFKIIKEDGFLFLSMETNMGMSMEISKLNDGHYEMPNGDIRFLLTEKILEKVKSRFNLLEIDERRILIIGNDKRYIYLLLSRQNNQSK